MQGPSKKVTSSFVIYATLMRFVASNNYVLSQTDSLRSAPEPLWLRKPGPSSDTFAPDVSLPTSALLIDDGHTQE